MQHLANKKSLKNILKEVIINSVEDEIAKRIVLDIREGASIKKISI